MYEHVKTGFKHIPPSEKPLQFQSGYYLNKPRKIHYVYGMGTSKGGRGQVRQLPLAPPHPGFFLCNSELT